MDMFDKLPPSVIEGVLTRRKLADGAGENRGPQLAGVLGFFLALTWIFTGLRVYVRLLISKNWAADDSVLMMALLVFTLFCASSIAGITHGTGRHVDDISHTDLPQALMFWWGCELFYTTTTALVRISMAIFLLRICVKKIHKIIIYTTMAAITVFSTYYFFLILFQCKPVDYFWNQYAGEVGVCIPSQWVPNSTLAHSAVSATADWVLGVLPVFLLKDLQMNLRTKLSVGVVMSLGVFAGIATVIRIPFIRVLSITDDFLFATVDVAIWSAVEPGVGIIAAAALALRPLFKKFYGLSSNGTAKSDVYLTNVNGLQASHSKQKLSVSSEDSFEGFDDDAVEMGTAQSKSVIRTTSNRNHKKSGNFFSNKSTTSTDGDEEKNSGWKVQVEHTVEVSTRDRERPGSVGSAISVRAAAPWRDEKD